MNKYKGILTVAMVLVLLRATAQISFIGFDTTICKSPMSNVYTYSNYTISPHINGFNIYKNGIKVYNYQAYNGPGYCFDLIFVNDSTGFLVAYVGAGVASVQKTTDFAQNWIPIGQGPPNYLGLYIVNLNFGYLVTYYNNSVWVIKVTDVQAYSTLIYDTIPDVDLYKADTILNNSLCNIDSLKIFIKYNSDSVTYHINISSLPGAVVNNDPVLNSLTLFPNPGNGSFNIVIPNDLLSEKNLILNIYDYTGKLIQQKALEMQEGKIKLNLREEAKGIYNVTLSSGKKSYSGKIVFE